MKIRMFAKLAILLVSIGMFGCSEAENEVVKIQESALVDKYLADTHYQDVKESVDTGTDKILVTAFFWYGCPHCEKFEAPLNKWKSNLPNDVMLEKMPAVWSEAMVLHAQLFYLAESMENSHDIHFRMFKETIAIRAEKDLAVQQAHFAKVFGEFGLSQDEFKQKLFSSKVKSQTQNAIKLMKASGLTGTPSVVVNGKYLVLGRSVPTAEGVLDIADYLIGKERAAVNKGQQ